MLSITESKQFWFCKPVRIQYKKPIDFTNTLNIIAMNKVVKAFVLKTNCLGLITILLFFIFINGCSKHDNVVHPPFTADQLGWINNATSLKYRCVTKTTDTQGNIITTIDTVVSQTEYHSHQEKIYNEDPEYSMQYYTGRYSFWIAHINVGIDTISYSFNIEINNCSDFVVKLTVLYSYDITYYNTDTVMINGILYNDVYKLENFIVNGFQPIIKIFFKKGVGPIYLEKSNGDNASISQEKRV